RECASAPVFYFFAGDNGALDGHDAGADQFAQHLVREPDHDDVEHGRMRVQPVLDLARIDVEAAADDQLLAPADDVDEPRIIDDAEVAGQEIAVLVERLRRLARLPVIAFHDAGPTDRDL